jgi:hypothetical protein
MGRYLRDGGEENEGESGSQGYSERCLAGPAADPQVTYKSPRRGIGSDGVRIRVNQVFEEGLGSRTTKRARTISPQQGPRFLGISGDKVPDKLKPEGDLKSTFKAENTEYLLRTVLCNLDACASLGPLRVESRGTSLSGSRTGAANALNQTKERNGRKWSRVSGDVVEGHRHQAPVHRFHSSHIEAFACPVFWEWLCNGTGRGPKMPLPSVKPSNRNMLRHPVPSARNKKRSRPEPRHCRKQAPTLPSGRSEDTPTPPSDVPAGAIQRRLWLQVTPTASLIGPSDLKRCPRSPYQVNSSARFW